MIEGIRVIPPTKTSSSISFEDNPASFKQALTGPIVRSRNLSVSCSSFARVSFFAMCFGPEASAVTNGRLISYSWAEESAIFAFSASSRILCNASGCPCTSIPESALNSAMIQSITAISQSSPPKWVSPLVAFTSKSPSPMSKTEISNVPPPKS